jgi:hypothetical protein
MVGQKLIQDHHRQVIRRKPPVHPTIAIANRDLLVTRDLHHGIITLDPHPRCDPALRAQRQIVALQFAKIG